MKKVIKDMSGIKRDIDANKAAANSVMIQTKTKSGKWGKAFRVNTYGDSIEKVIERLTKLNAGKEYRAAE